MASTEGEKGQKAHDQEAQDREGRSELGLGKSSNTAWNSILGALAGISVAYMISRRTFDSMRFYDESVGYKYIALFVGCASAGSIVALFLGDQMKSEEIAITFNRVCLVLIAVGIFVWTLPVVG